MPYCCSIGCDTAIDLTPYGMTQPTCSTGDATLADIFAVASADGCGPLTEGSCAWDSSADAKCVSQGFCPAAVPPATMGCVPGVLAGAPSPPISPPPSASPSPPPLPPSDDLTVRPTPSLPTPHTAHPCAAPSLTSDALPTSLPPDATDEEDEDEDDDDEDMWGDDDEGDDDAKFTGFTA